MGIANTVALAMLSEHPDLKALLCCNDSMALGPFAAVKAAGRDDALVAGFDNISALTQGDKEGTIVATADQHGDQLAVYSIEYALQILRGESTPQDKETPVDLVTAETLQQPMASPLLRGRGARKSYSAPVLTEVGVELHALIGTNGDGKSTFASIISGLTAADRGEMTLASDLYAPAGKADAEACGVHIVQQELNLISVLSVAENLFLNHVHSRLGFSKLAALYDEAKVALKSVGLGDIDLETAVGKLGVGKQQLIEITAALSRRCQVVILEEPTAALTAPQVDLLFDHLKRLRASGVGIIYISHRLEDLREISDTATVLQDGEVVAIKPFSNLALKEIVLRIVGREVEEEQVGRDPRHSVGLRVDGLCCGDLVKDVTFEARTGRGLRDRRTGRLREDRVATRDLWSGSSR